MAEENKKEETTEEKKGGFSGWWNKTKANVNSSILESKLESTFNKGNVEFVNYNKGEMFSNSYYGYYKNGTTVTIYGKKLLKTNSVLIDKKNNKAFYVVSVVDSKVEVKYEGQIYERDASDILLDPNVTEVNVIKAGDRFFLYKGESKEA